MKFKAKPNEVEAMQYDGTFMGSHGVQAAQDFLSIHDVEDCEVTCQGTDEPLALDVTNAYGLITIEAGDYLYIAEGELYAAKRSVFEQAYEADGE